jgi:hypothetical protein
MRLQPAGRRRSVGSDEPTADSAGCHAVNGHVLGMRAITTIVGTGEPGYSGDHGPAVKARLNEPKGLALDGQGPLSIADAENHMIRQVDLESGRIITIAGRVETSHEGNGLVGVRCRGRTTTPWPIPLLGRLRNSCS